MTTVRSRPRLVTGERVRLRFLESSNNCCHQLKLEDYSERALKTVLVAWGRPQGGHAMLNPFFQYLYCTVLYEKSNNLLPIFPRCADVQQSITTPCTLFEKWGFTTVSQCHCSRNGDLLLCHSATKMRICCAQLHCIEVNVPGTNFSVK